MLHAQWNLGDMIWFWLAAVVILVTFIVFIPALIVFIKAEMDSDSDRSWTAGSFAVGSVLVGVIVVAISLFVFWPPFQTQYYKYVPVSGIVQNTPSSRFIASDTQGGGSSQRYLVTINGQQYGCDDTRCSGLAKGQAVTLMCERLWESNGTPGFVCNWGKLGLNN